MEEFKRSHLHSSHTSFDPGGCTSSRRQGLSSPSQTYSTVNRARPFSSPRSSPSASSASSDPPHRRPIHIDVTQPVRSFSGPLHPSSFSSDAPTYTAYLHLGTAQSDAGISTEPVIIDRHKACMRKGLAAVHKSHLVGKALSPIDSVTLPKSFPWELELLNTVLTRVETRPRIGSRCNGFRVESKSYKTLLQILTARRRSARDGFTINGRKPPAIPSWGDGFDLGPGEFYMLTDFELLAVCFRAEVEHFLLELRQFWSFTRRRPIIVPWDDIPTRRGSLPPSSGTLKSSNMCSFRTSPCDREHILVTGRHVADIPTHVDVGTELDNHLSNTSVAIVGVPSPSVPLSNSTSPAALISEPSSHSSEFAVCASTLVAQLESNISSAQPEFIEPNAGPPAPLSLSPLSETSHGGIEPLPCLSRSCESFGDGAGFMNKGVQMDHRYIHGESATSPATVTREVAAGTIIPTAGFSALSPGRGGTAITSLRLSSYYEMARNQSPWYGSLPRLRLPQGIG
ncbi:hypothetical protein DFH06DRAFT_1129010 [Mycena polygramma]|nr:hypothetical protein DFH06DRAFT_1129009 [Mycena polygramma]KAJ7662794.1 hypothetical protein DFH06DRAFT_1129010 [Mycena polygramma]